MQIVPVAHSSYQIQFTSAAGEAVVGWKGAELPTLGEAVDVELEIDDARDWSEIEVVDAEPGLHRTPDAVVRGRVVAVDEDGVLTLSIAGATVLLETRGQAPDGLIGTVIQFDAARISAYPTGI